MWWVPVFLVFYIRFLVLCLESPGALTLGLTYGAFFFLFCFLFLVYHPADGREKKEKGVASGTANLTGGERIKKYTRDG